MNGCLFNQVAEEGANGSAQEFYEENVANLRELLQEWDDATPFSIKGAYNLAKQSLKIIEGRTQRLECAVHRVEQVIEKAPESAGHRARLDKRPTFEIADPAVKTYEIVETPAGHYPNNKGRNGRPILSAKR